MKVSRIGWIVGTAAAGLLLGCGQETQPQSPATVSSFAPTAQGAGPGKIAYEFEARIDPATGGLAVKKMQPMGDLGQHAAALSILQAEQNGIPQNGNPNTVELVTTNIRRGAMCPGGGTGNTFCGDVTIGSFYTSALSNIYVQLVSVTPSGHEAYNSDPSAMGLDNSIGLWSYGSLPGTASPTGVQSAAITWAFNMPVEENFTIRGYVWGDVVSPTTVFVPALPNTLATFELDGNTNDSSGNGRNATLLGGSFVPTPFGQGLFVNADPQGFDWSAYAGTLTHPFTIELVFRPLALGGWQKLFSFNDTLDNGHYLNGNNFFSYSSGPPIGTFTNGPLYYVALVSTSATTMDVYINGALAGTSGMNYSAPGPSAVFFRDDSGTGRAERFMGIVEGVRLSSVARTAGEIATQQTHFGP